MITNHRIRNRDGNMLLVTVGVLFLVTAMTIGVLAVAMNALHLSNRQRYTSLAFNVAESGAERAMFWLYNQPAPPSQTSPFDPFGGVQALSDGTDAVGNYSVTIYPQSGPDTYLKVYRIVSVGTVSGVMQKVEIVAQQATFGRYAYFTDKETMSSGNPIYWKAGEVVDGPAHSNNTDGTYFNINYMGSNAPIFQDILTASGNKINYDPSNPRDESTYKKIFKEGSKGFKLGVPTVPLPESTDVQMKAAWGSIPSCPINGVYVRADVGAGIYIKGDAKSVVFSVDASGNQQIAITQRVSSVDNVTTVTVDRNASTTTVKMPDGTTTTTPAVPNGVIYCDGNIDSLKGEIADNKVAGDQIVDRSAWTVATNAAAGKDITIADNIKYHTRPDKTLDMTDPVNLRAGTLGLVADDITIANNGTVKAPQNLEIDAVMLAGSCNSSTGSFSVEDYSNKKPAGTLTVLGGIIQKARGAVGTFDPSTGITTSGYAKNYHYDPRLATNPPPFYPTTGQYDRLSWQVLP